MREFHKIWVEQCEAARDTCQSSASFESLIPCPILLRFPSPLLRDLTASRWRSTISTGISSRCAALLGHARIETTQLYAQIRPAALEQAVEFYEAKAPDVLSR
jgi:hypothetical protein